MASLHQQIKQHIAEHHSPQNNFWNSPNILGSVLTHQQNPTNPNQLHLLQAILASGLPVGDLLGGLGAGGEGAEGANAAERLTQTAGRAKGAVKSAGSKLESSKIGQAIAKHPYRAAAAPLALAGAGLSAAGAVNNKKGAKKSGGSGSGKSSSSTPPSADSSQIGSGIMPLFMSSIIGPYMKNVMDQINQTSKGYGDYMNSLLTGPNSVALNPAVRQALSAMIPGQQATMGLMGQSALGSAVGNSALDQLSQQIQLAQQAQQSAAGMYEKYMVPLEYSSGTGMTTGASPTSFGLPASLTSAGASNSPMYQQLRTQQIANAGG